MKDVKNYYDEVSVNYDKAFDVLYFKIFDAITWKYLEPHVPRDTNASVLDAGGGTGRWAIRMAEEGCRVVLMDSSDGMLKIAAQKIKATNLQNRIIIEKGDIRETGYSGETFDMILCEHALFLFKNPDRVISELVRILKTGAPLIVSVVNRYVQSLASVSGKPSPDNVERALKTLFAKHYECISEDGKGRIYTWTPDEFRKMLEENGLTVEKIVGKCATMPLRIRKETYTREDYSHELFDRILEYELALCEKPDALALAGQLQAIARKS